MVKATPAPAPDAPEFLNERELSKRICVSMITLQQWRHRGEGPPFYKLGRRVVYRWDSVQRWLEANRRGED
jgi:predicted site-specific integrase-resolvase